MVAPLTLGKGLTIGNGITFGAGTGGGGGGGGPSFLIGTSDIIPGTPMISFGSNMTNYSNLGFDYAAGSPGGDIATHYYSIGFDFTGNGMLQSKVNALTAFWSTNSLTTDGTGYIFEIAWSQSTTSKAIVGLYVDGGATSGQIYIAPVYEGNNDWQTPSQSLYSLYAAGPASGGSGYIFPATFTLVTPKIAQSADWY